MGRSVAVPRDAMQVVYLSDVAEDSDDFDWFLDGLRDDLARAFPSLRHQDSWIGRELHLIAESKVCGIGVSEYCGIVAVWMCPNRERRALAERWCEQVGGKFTSIVSGYGNALRSIGTASNGEQFFQPVDAVQRGDMGLGFTSKEGWL